MPSAGGWAAALGFSLMTHAAYAVISGRQLAKLTQQEYSGVPILVAVELLASVAILLRASLALSGSFKPISGVNAGRGLQTHNFRPDFMRFNHRGRVLPAVLPTDHPLSSTLEGS